MGKSFRDIADDARAQWTDDAVVVNDAAARVFSAEVDLHAELGAELLRLRSARRLTQPELQRLSGVQQAEISRIERGVGNPTLATLEKLTHALGGRLVLVDSDGSA
ncbi:helix-turn-helix domain-containing protein [Demequina silvatica]|uniref:helix-turn-helix domain-containing protein n=1 Tax=Demequina silvatica TaxID=1638988 RepID=UPI0007803265|nr:helix-turn-helix transcriptional regulator [Demequina silvatica]